MGDNVAAHSHRIADSGNRLAGVSRWEVQVGASSGLPDELFLANLQNVALVLFLFSLPSNWYR